MFLHSVWFNWDLVIVSWLFWIFLTLRIASAYTPVCFLLDKKVIEWVFTILNVKPGTLYICFKFRQILNLTVFSEWCLIMFFLILFALFKKYISFRYFSFLKSRTANVPSLIFSELFLGFKYNTSFAASCSSIFKFKLSSSL